MNRKTYQVLWTQTARRDLRKVLEYIAADNEKQAGKIFQAIKQKADNLQQMPLQGRIVPELSYFNILNYRELINPPWRIIYKVEENKVWVLAVIDGRRNVEDILLDRLLSGEISPDNNK
jgi:toxin ParE1/3/4